MIIAQFVKGVGIIKRKRQNRSVKQDIWGRTNFKMMKTLEIDRANGPL